ncbi:MAG TPA: arabinan endo-1,5-alpha-L-arabinosidase [Rhizomicrobium sp.]
MTGAISPIHDPCIIKDGDTYYVFCTTMDDKKQAQIPVHTSKDLIHWKAAGYAFPKIPDWALKMIPATKGIWAPDISYRGGTYYLYYSLSSFGSIHSVIGCATSTTLDPKSPQYKWVDHGLVFMSDKGSSFNCIDPAHIFDREGNRWLAFGSFWTGIKMIRLDPKTGKQSQADKTIYTLAARPIPEGGLDTVEACFLIERGGWYYLFASYDYCCKGVNSTYYTAMGRCKNITGPYLDKQGRKMTEGYGWVILKADQEEQGRWRGPGHCAVLRDPGQDYIVYHAYDKLHKGAPYLRIAPLVWSADGWSTAVV